MITALISPIYSLHFFVHQGTIETLTAGKAVQPSRDMMRAFKLVGMLHDLKVRGQAGQLSGRNDRHDRRIRCVILRRAI